MLPVVVVVAARHVAAAGDEEVQLRTPRLRRIQLPQLLAVDEPPPPRLQLQHLSPPHVRRRQPLRLHRRRQQRQRQPAV